MTSYRSLLIPALLLATTVAWGQGTRLEFKFKVGDVKQRKAVTSNTVTADMIPGGSQTSESSMFSTERVDSVFQDGSASLTVSVDSMSITVNGQPMSGGPQSGLVGTKFRVVRAKTGKATRGEILGELSGMSKTAAEGYMQNIVSAPGYPDRPLNQGESWDEVVPLTQRTMGGEVKMTMKLKMTFVGMDKQLGFSCAVMKISGTIKGEGAQAKFEGTLKGNRFFALAEGMDVKSFMDTDMNIEADTPQGPQSMVTKTSQKTELQK